MKTRFWPLSRRVSEDDRFVVIRKPLGLPTRTYQPGEVLPAGAVSPRRLKQLALYRFVMPVDAAKAMGVPVNETKAAEVPVAEVTEAEVPVAEVTEAEAPDEGDEDEEEQPQASRRTRR